MSSGQTPGPRGQVAGALAIVGTLALLKAVAPASVFSLSLVCGGAALAVLLAARFRQHEQARAAAALRKGDRQGTIERLRLRVRRAQQRQDYPAVQLAVRDALEVLLLAGAWDEVSWFVEAAEGLGNLTFRRWLLGISALAALHEGDGQRAAEALSASGLEGDWLQAIDAFRLALAGAGAEALERLGDTPPSGSMALAHQRWLAEVHALAALGHTHEVRALLAGRMDALPAVVLPEGPATPIAIGIMTGGSDPYRSVH